MAKFEVKAYEVTITSGLQPETTKESQAMRNRGLKPQRYFSCRLVEPEKTIGKLRGRSTTRNAFPLTFFENQNNVIFTDIVKELQDESNYHLINDKNIQLLGYGVFGVVTEKLDPNYYYVKNAKNEIQYRADGKPVTSNRVRFFITEEQLENGQDGVDAAYEVARRGFDWITDNEGDNDNVDTDQSNPSNNNQQSETNQNNADTNNNQQNNNQQQGANQS